MARGWQRSGPNVKLSTPAVNPIGGVYTIRLMVLPPVAITPKNVEEPTGGVTSYDDMAPLVSRTATAIVAVAPEPVNAIRSEPTAVTTGEKSAISGVPKPLAKRESVAMAGLPPKPAGATKRSTVVPRLELKVTPAGIDGAMLELNV